MITEAIVESKINELNDILNDDCQSKQFYLLCDNKQYYLVDENEQIYDRGSLKSIHKTVCLLFIFYCEISA